MVQFTKEFVLDNGVPSDTITTHLMELRPYIEEPIPRILPSSQLNNHRMIRHDFVLLKQEFVDAYWETLECCYLTAGLAEPLSAFPGCSVPEVCRICYTSLMHKDYYLILTTKETLVPTNQSYVTEPGHIHCLLLVTAVLLSIIYY